MKAVATTVLKLVQGSKVFLIPTFQRRYTWKKEQWNQLWLDLLNEYEVDYPEDPDALHGHFLGSVVLHPALGPASTLMRHQVIDGQQRLTTILVLLAALRDTRAAADSSWNYGAIDDQYLRNPFSDEYPDRLIPTKLDREAFRKTVRERVPTGDIGIAYNFFRTSMERALAAGDIELAKLERTLLLHMLIVEITTKTGDSVNGIFNTLNSKGMELSAADLVRNELLHHIGDDLGDEVHEEYWIPMETSLVSPKAKSPDREFVTFLWAREVSISPKTSRDDLFPTFERRLRNDLSGKRPADRQEIAMAVLKEMYEDHRLFLTVRDPSHGEEDERISDQLLASLYSIQEWRSEPITPIALWVLKEAVEGRVAQSDASKALDILLSYLVKRILHGIPTNQLNRLLTPVAHELSQRNEHESVAERMHEILSRPGYYWPTDDQVRSTVVTNPLYASARRYVKFLLEAAERHFPGAERAELERTQIEHVMPQLLSSDWSEHLQSRGVELSDAEALTHTLGNLTLTESNQKMGNASFFAKRDEYLRVSAVRMNRSLAELDDFVPANIEKRSLALLANIFAEFTYSPRSRAVEFSADDSGASVAERLESLLQTLPVDTWLSEDELVSVLGAKARDIRSIANDLDPTLARLIREPDGSVPSWFTIELRSEIILQDEAQPPLGKRVESSFLENLAAANSGSSEEREFDDVDEG